MSMGMVLPSRIGHWHVRKHPVELKQVQSAYRERCAIVSWDLAFGNLTSGLIIVRDMTLNDVRDVREVLRSHTMYLNIITTIHLRY